MPSRSTRTEKLDLRLTLAAKHVISRAAQAMNRYVSEFVLESALARAEETLPDRSRFGLDADEWAAFVEALDAPTRPLPQMARLLGEPSVFERNEEKLSP